MKGTLKACTVKVIVDIGGREAIPVRAIPWLTARKRMSADVVADVLSGSYKVGAMVGLVAYRVEGTNVVAVEIQHWKNAARDLGVLRISSRNAHGNKDTPDSHELEHSDWRAQAISLLPAGVFVWKDEFENSYEGTYGPYQRLKNEAALNFTPLIPNEPDRQCVMDGFLWGDPARHADKPTLVADAPEQADTKPQAGAVEAAPVVAVPASETPEQRRARWLDWRGEGERGAVQRVYERELQRNPKADRSFVGKQIKIARTEQAEKKRAGGWASQLVKGGKRSG